ncbi:MAG TPA: ABC transporter permease [Actinomycetes bacterium]|nr:ABC transporter permease [Actinomycetes bacterium]
MSLDVAEPQTQTDAPAVVVHRRPAAVRWAAAAWAWVWPKALAVAIVVGFWQFLFLIEWRPPFVLPSPSTVFSSLGDLATTSRFWDSVSTTLQRAAVGYLTALLIGSFIGIAVSRIRTLRLAIGSLITGLQTMPSIAWFPFAIVVFGGTENAIYFVVVLGAAPSIANGIIAGIDHVPPSYVRLGKVMGARNLSLYRHVVLPAALPSYVAGLSQGWAFAWRSLMAGELLVLALGVTSVGASLDFARQLNHMDEVIAWMIVILVIGMIADTIFTGMSRTIRRRRGLAIDD